MLNIRDDPISYATQERVPLFLHVAYPIREKSDKRHGNPRQGRISQCKQGMYQQERSMVSYETRHPRSSIARNYANNDTSPITHRAYWPK